MSNDTPIIDPYEKLKIVANPDGTITRLEHYQYSPASCDDLTQPALSKDFTIDQSKSTWLRLYLPREALEQSSPRLPVILYFHGGGMAFYSAATPEIHRFCADLSADTKSLVASVEYRLAPEHRLPAAYDDALDALRWLGAAAEAEDDGWVREYADLSRCFLMGGSGGGNIAYGAGLRTAAAAEDAGPALPLPMSQKLLDGASSAVVRGLILQQPFFGGTRRTASELRLEYDAVLPLCMTDLLWEMVLPLGAGRDHQYCDPLAAGGSAAVAAMAKNGWRVLVSACYDDPLFDRQADVAKMLEERGLEVVVHFGPGNHGSDAFDPSLVKLLYVAIEKFIYA